MRGGWVKRCGAASIQVKGGCGWVSSDGGCFGAAGGDRYSIPRGVLLAAAGAWWGGLSAGGWGSINTTWGGSLLLKETSATGCCSRAPRGVGDRLAMASRGDVLE